MASPTKREEPLEAALIDRVIGAAEVLADWYGEQGDPRGGEVDGQPRPVAALCVVLTKLLGRKMAPRQVERLTRLEAAVGATFSYPHSTGAFPPESTGARVMSGLPVTATGFIERWNRDQGGLSLRYGLTVNARRFSGRQTLSPMPELARDNPQALWMRVRDGWGRCIGQVLVGPLTAAALNPDLHPELAEVLDQTAGNELRALSREAIARSEI